MSNAYTAEQRIAAKSLATALGSPRAAHEALLRQWGENPDLEVPSDRTIERWMTDRAIELDREFIEGFAERVRHGTIGSAHRLIEKLEERALAAIANPEESALNVFNIVKAWGVATDKVNGRFGNAAVVVAQQGGTVLLAYGPVNIQQREEPKQLQEARREIEIHEADAT